MQKKILFLISIILLIVAVQAAGRVNYNDLANTKDCHHDYFSLGDVSLVDHRAVRDTETDTNVFPGFVKMNATRTKPARPIRITFDYQGLIKDYFGTNVTNSNAYLNISDATLKANALANKAVFEFILGNLSNYFANLINIYPELNPIKFPAASKCQDITNTTVNATWQTTGNNNSDLVVFLKDDINIVQHTGFSCMWLSKTGSGDATIYPAQPDRPIFGIIRVVQSLLLPANIKTAKWSQTKILEIYNSLLHQMFHILGLSKFDYTWWHRNEFSYYSAQVDDVVIDPLDDSDFDVNYKRLNTPHIQRAAYIHFENSDDMHEYQDDFSDYSNFYYSSSNNQGIFLENSELTEADAEILLSSHFEATIAFGEIMTTSGYFSSQYPSIVSIFTISALQDTGFYASIQTSLAEYLSFGSGASQMQERLCYLDDDDFTIDFFTFQSALFELSDTYNGYTWTTTDESCDFYGLNYGYSSDFPNTGLNYLDAECQVLLPDSSEDSCTNDQVLSDQYLLTHERRGINSRCLSSTLDLDFGQTLSTQNYRCYELISDKLLINNFPRESPTYQLEERIGFNLKIGNLTTKGFFQFQPNLPFFGNSYQASVDFLPSVYYGTMCPNFCSTKGICVRGRGCQCSPNWFGPDCSISNATRVLACSAKTFPGGKGIWLAENDSCIDPVSCNSTRLVPKLDENGDVVLNDSGKPVLEPVHTFWGKTGSTCVSCPFGCQVCVDDKKCTKCADDFYMQEGKCVRRCDFPDFYYDTVTIPSKQDEMGNLIFFTQCTRTPYLCTDCYLKANPECTTAFVFNYDLDVSIGGCTIN